MPVLGLSRAWALRGLAPTAALTREEGYTVPQRCSPPALCQGNLLDRNPKVIMEVATIKVVKTRSSAVAMGGHG